MVTNVIGLVGRLSHEARGPIAGRCDALIPESFIFFRQVGPRMSHGMMNRSARLVAD